MLRLILCFFVSVLVFSPAMAGDMIIRPAEKGFSHDYPGTLGQSSRFLNQATFGSPIEEIHRLRFLGYSAWIAEQVALPISLQRPAIEAVVTREQDDLTTQRMAIWWEYALHAPD